MRSSCTPLSPSTNHRSTTGPGAMVRTPLTVVGCGAILRTGASSCCRKAWRVRPRASLWSTVRPSRIRSHPFRARGSDGSSDPCPVEHRIPVRSSAPLFDRVARGGYFSFDASAIHLPQPFTDPIPSRGERHRGLLVRVPFGSQPCVLLLVGSAAREGGGEPQVGPVVTRGDNRARSGPTRASQFPPSDQVVLRDARRL